MRRTNRHGDKKGHKIKAKPKENNQAFMIKQDEDRLNKTRLRYEDNKDKRRQPDDLTINYAALGGIDKKLMSSPIMKLKVNVKTKTYKRWGKK